MNYSKFRMSETKYNEIKGVQWPLFDEFISTRLSNLCDAVRDEIIEFNKQNTKVYGLDYMLHDNTHNYYNIFWDYLRIKFKNSELLGENYSHSWQDIFVLSMLNGKTNGTYLEIGANRPIVYNNTFLLEHFYNFTGVSIDKLDFSIAWSIRPKSKFMCVDAASVDYHKLLTDNFTNRQIDYGQIDIDSPVDHLKILKSLLSSGYRFSVFTYETCADNADIEIKKLVDEARECFLSNGYMLIASDVLHWFDNEMHRLEDWWVDPAVIESTILDKFKNIIPLNECDPFYLLIDTGE